MAWRNLWRVPRRTILTLAALGIGVAGIVFLGSYRESTWGLMIRTVTTQLVGDAQIHGKGYHEAPSMSTVVGNPRQVEAQLRDAVPGTRTQLRVVGSALAGSDTGSTGAVVNGIEPDEGSTLLTLKTGTGLSGTAGREAVVGLTMAEELGLSVGSELVLVGQASDGSVANDVYRVVGLADTGSEQLNATGVFIHLADAQSFFVLGDAVHVVMVNLPEAGEDLTGPLSTVKAALDLTTLEALSWNELLPELRGTMDEKRAGQRAMDYVVFLLVGLGVLNVITMSTFERTREFGILMAIGSRPGRVLRLVVTEALLQGALGVTIGVVLAASLLTAIGSIHLGGLSVDVVGVRMPSEVPLVIDWGGVGRVAVMALVTMALGAVVPAFRASRLDPATAVREV